MWSITRRDLLKLTASSLIGLSAGCGAGFEPEEIPESVVRFPRTPITGDVRSDRAMLAFFVADDSAVTLRVWDEAGAVVVDEALAPSGDGFHKLRVDALSAGTVYRWAVFGGEAPDFTDRSLIARFRTAPAESEAPVVRLALLACVGQGTVLPDYYMPPGTDNPTTEPFQWELFRSAAGLGLDLDGFVHLGDQAYLDFVWSRQDGTVEAYKHAWGFYHGGGYRDIYPLAPLYATWDDHESTDNRHFDPWEMPAEDAAKLANAQEVWYRLVPIDAMTPDEAPVWRSFRWGATVELILLDCRYELNPGHQMSEAQLAFLLERIEASPCRFVCVATPRPFAKIATSNELSADSQERWESFPLDRDRVTALLDTNETRKVVFVTGDIHMNYLGRTTESGTSVAESSWEVCCTSGNESPFADGLSATQFPFVSKHPHLPLLTFDPGAGTVHVAFYAKDGALAFEQTLTDV